MKYQMTVDGVLVADYYNLDKVVDHTRVALEDGRFTTVQVAKVNDDGSPFQADQGEAADPNAAMPVEAQPAPQPEAAPADPNAVQYDANGNVVPQDAALPTAAAPVQL